MLVYILLGLLVVVLIVVAIVVTKKVTESKAKAKYSFVGVTEYNTMLMAILEEHFKTSSIATASQNILVILQKYYKIDYATIFLAHNNNNVYVLNAIATNVQGSYIEALEAHCNSLLENIGDLTAKVSTSNGGCLSYNSAKDRGICFSAFSPLMANGKIVGGVLLENKDAQALEAEKLRFELYDKVFKSTALVLQNVLNTERLVYAVSTDQLTGVFNRRYIDTTLDEQLIIHKNLGLPFHLAIMDIDFFKKFNDTYGHQFGDLVLKIVSNFLKKNCGTNAWVGRYGGEEFVVFFGRSDTHDVFHKVDRLRAGISKLKLSDGTAEASVTASFGIACYPTNATDVKSVIEKADTALYESKHTGRNKVTLAK